MYIARKGGKEQILNNSIQASAFRNSGWTVETVQNSSFDELSSLREEADRLELSYHPKIGIAKLREKIEEEKAKMEAKKQF